MPVPEPTIADVLTRLDQMDARLERMSARLERSEVRAEVVALEHRAGLAELRNDVAELRQRLNMMFDFLADFRREYGEHTHGGEAA